MNKGLYIIAIILILSSALFFSGCKKQCELISYGDYDSGSGTGGDSDGIFIPPADNDNTDGDMDQSGDEDNSDIDIEAGESGGDYEPGEYEVWDYEPDIDLEQSDGIDIAPEVKVMKYDGRTAGEFSPFGFWEYWLERPEESSESISRARLSKNFGSEAEQLYFNDGSSKLSNPPLSSCVKAVRSDLIFSAYRIFNADGRADDFDNSFVLRREYKTSNEVQVDYYKVDLPDKPEEMEFRQVCLLPDQSESSSSKVNVIIAWVKYVSEFKSYVTTQTYTANLISASPRLNELGQELQTMLPGGFTDRTKMRIIESGNMLYLNAGSSIIRYDSLGEIESQNSIIYPIADISSKDIVDFAVSPDGQFVSAVSHLALSGDKHETVWTLHKTDSLNLTEKIHRFGGSFDLYRTEFTPESDYAVVCNPDPTINDDFYLMKLSGNHRIEILRQAVWGRPMFINNPQRLLQIYPVSEDEFKSTYNIIETRTLSDILDEAVYL